MIKLTRNNGYIFSLLLIGGLLLSGGCNKEEKNTPPSPAHQAQAKNTPPPVQKQPSSANVSANTVPSLEFANRKDPFKPFVPAVAQPEKPIGSVRTSEQLPIQSYELSKFKVAGIIVGLKENTALVVDPSGKGYVVKRGMLIGDSDGRITRITATSIEVIEKYRDDGGRIKSRTVQLTLPKKK